MQKSMTYMEWLNAVYPRPFSNRFDGPPADRPVNPNKYRPCSECGELRPVSRSSAPVITCQPCRRARNAMPLGNEQCPVCGKALSDEQRKRGGQFCSAACGYVHILRINPEPYVVPSKRVRRFGVCRAVDEESGQVLHGPGRRQKFSLHRYDDGRWTICCRWCMEHLPIELGQSIVQCTRCPLITHLDRPLGES